jgi:hypothetical protein
MKGFGPHRPVNERNGLVSQLAFFSIPVSQAEVRIPSAKGPAGGCLGLPGLF